jgi:hypothetical protein
VCCAAVPSHPTFPAAPPLSHIGAPSVMWHALGSKPRHLSPCQHAAQWVTQPLALLPRLFTCRGQLMASLASSSLHCFDETCWRIHPAPRPAEVVWASLGLRVWEVSLRSLGVWVMFVLLVLFYLPITAAIQAPVNMDNLQKVRGGNLCGFSLERLCKRGSCWHVCWKGNLFQHRQPGEGGRGPRGVVPAGICGGGGVILPCCLAGGCCDGCGAACGCFAAERSMHAQQETLVLGDVQPYAKRKHLHLFKHRSV